MEEEGCEFILSDLPQEEDEDFKFSHVLNDEALGGGEIKITKLTSQKEKGIDDLEIVGEIKGEIIVQTQVVENPMSIPITKHQQLTAHEKSADGVRKYMCSICGEHFGPNWQKLSNHESKVHSQIRPYKCAKCTKSFKLALSLEKHSKTPHTGIRLDAKGPERIMCDFCAYWTRSQWRMTRHIRLHTGEKPFKCTYPNCSRDYLSKSLLNWHLLTHTPESEPEPEPEPVDDSGMNQPREQRHHAEEKPFKCTYTKCSKDYKFKSTLQRHILTAHSHSPQPGGSGVIEVFLEKSKCSGPTTFP